MTFTPCKRCPRPDWCSAGNPRCEIPSLEEAAENLRLTGRETSGEQPSEAKAGAPIDGDRQHIHLGAGVYQDTYGRRYVIQGDGTRSYFDDGTPIDGSPQQGPFADGSGGSGTPTPDASAEAPASSSTPPLLEVKIRWPSPMVLLPISRPLAGTATQVWEYIDADGEDDVAAERYNTIVDAAGDALALLQKRIMTISEPGKVSYVGMYSAMSALVAMYLTYQWVQNPPQNNEHASHITSIFGAYAHAVAVEIMRDLQDRGLIAPPAMDEPTEADKIAEAFRNGQ